jgi:ferredoxin
MSEIDKHYVILIEPKGWRLEASGALTLLESARMSDISLPSSCRNGTCRTCMCRLLSGRVAYKIEWPGLSADEKKEGLILPCVAYPETDVTIEASAAVRLPTVKK